LSFPILSLDRHFFDDRRWVMLGENPQLELRPPGSRAGALRFKRKDPKRLTDSRAHVARTPSPPAGKAGRAICRKTTFEPAYFPEERNRALLGVALYAFAGAIGWAYSPRVALVIYMTLPVFYGITSEGQTETRIVLLLWRRSRPPTP
jgi:hypothetical protein